MRHHLDGSARWAGKVADNAYQDDLKKNSLNKNRFKTCIVNAGDGKNQHPTQCLLDLFTIKEITGRIDDMDIGLFNDLKYGRTTHSLIKAAALFKNIRLHLAFPSGFGLEKYYIDFLKRNNIQYFIYDNIIEPLGKIDIAYITRYQKERFRDENERKNIGDKWVLTADLIEKSKPKKNLKILHPLPIDKEMQEIHSSVHSTDYAYYFQQAANGVYLRQALFGLITGRINGIKFSDTALQKNKQVKIIDIPVAPHKKNLSNPRSGYIESDGIVIDHIAVNRSRRMSGFLGFEFDEYTPITLAKCLNGPSGLKDLLKIHKKYDLTERDLIKIAVLSPDAVISIIENGNVIKKFKIQLPHIIENMIYCSNDRCISNPDFKESVIPESVIISTNPYVYKCSYCETETDFETIWNKRLFVYD